MSIEWGMKAAIFVDDRQVGALKNWTLTESCTTKALNPKRPLHRVSGWTASAVRYILKEDITDKEVEFRFVGKINYFVCKGTITGGPYNIGEPSKGPLTMEIFRCQVKFR